MSWLAIISQREEVAASWLRSQSIEVFYPQKLRRIHRTNGAWVRRPLWKNYLFANLGEGHIWQELRRRGSGKIDDVVRIGPEPCVIPDRVLEEIRMRCDEHGVIPPPAIKAGLQYLVINGSPFRGLVALVEQIGGKECKAWIGTFQVTMPAHHLDPEPVMTRVEKGRQSRPLEARRKVRAWEPIE